MRWGVCEGQRDGDGGNNVCGKLKDRKRAKYLMLGLNEIIDQLAMANYVHLYGHVLRSGVVKSC